jgi:hypothetical protein
VLELHAGWVLSDTLNGNGQGVLVVTCLLCMLLSILMLAGALEEVAPQPEG